MQEEFIGLSGNIYEGLEIRLKEAVRLAGGVSEVAPRTEVSAASIYNYLKLKPMPPTEFLYRLAYLANVRLPWLLSGDLPKSEGGESGDWETLLGSPPIGKVRVPVLDVAASAGHGIEPLTEDPVDWMMFSLRALVGMGNPDTMSILLVNGDSMQPELRDGDQVMIDRSQCQVKDGIYVVLHDEQLFIKRVRVKGRQRVELISTNPDYPSFEVGVIDDGDLQETSQALARIIGRMVWSGRKVA